ncbi:MAG: hypothetical protein IKT46_02850 [Clostridia bacterium]|nr:hypothetical protein [Clostridia bacterium]
MNKICTILLIIAAAVISGVAAGLLAGFGLLGNYFAAVLFMLILSAIIFIGYALLRCFCCTSRLPLLLSGVSVLVNTLALGLVSGFLVDVAVAIGFIFAIAFAVFAAAIVAVIVSR